MQSDLVRAVQWAAYSVHRWAFTDRNAGSRVASFSNSLAELGKVNWDAVVTTNWSNPLIKESKQAEFLMFDFFPWELVERIGVIDHETLEIVSRTIENAVHKPLVAIERDWYY